MKRVLTFLLIAVLLVSIVPTAFAAERGDTVTITFNTSGNPGFKNFKSTINYPAEVLELTNITAGALCNGGMPMANAATGEFAFAGFMPVTGDGTVFTATFTIKDSAPAGTYDVGATLNYAYDANSGNISFGITGGSVTVIVPPCPDDAHDWEYSKFEQPTCDKPGDVVGKCKICGTEFVGQADALGHDYGPWSKLDDTYHQRVCSRDEAHIEKVAHTWDKGTVTTQPDCKNPGVKTFKCTTEGCTAEKTEPIAATGKHVYTNWTQVDKDVHEGACGCGEKKQEAHKWNAGVITTQPTCKDEGVKTFTCSVCNGTKTEAVAATGKHVYTASYVDNKDGKTHTGVCACGTKNPTAQNHTLVLKETINPDCKNAGKKVYECSVCKGIVEVKVDSTGKHNYETWTSDGEKTHTSTCTGCNSEKKTEDHIWNKGEITKQPNCKETGVKTYTCTAKGCGQTKTETLEKTTTHTFGDWTKVDDETHKRVCTICQEAEETAKHTWQLTEKVAATCVAKGSEKYTCKDCGATKTVELAVDPNGHVFGYINNEETENHTVYCKNECGMAPFYQDHTHNIFGNIVGGKQEKLCVCGDKIEVALTNDYANLDDVPKTGDITGQIVAFAACGMAAMMAVAFVFKRKAVK